MPELLLELFSEEIPARMQARGADDLARLLGEALAALGPRDVRSFHGPRRIAYVAEVAAEVPASRQSERGPRVTAPEQALAGFLRKHGAAREALQQQGEFWVLERAVPGMDAGALIAREVPGVLRRFPWPKSMRWGGTSAFTWVRPLRRICCLLDGAVVAFDLRQGQDDGHGLASGDVSEGHRFLAPGAFAVSSAAQWQAELRARFVVADAAERRALVEAGLGATAAERGLAVVPDAGLLDEVTGLVEWPVPLLGRIGPEFMDLPPEVMQVSMRVNQRYFALRDPEGRPAPWFAFVSNIPGAPDAGAIVAGNERVLRARFSDARHFWDLDRKRTLASRVADLDAVTFHAKLGSQGDRVQRLVRIAGEIAPLVGANVEQARRAALLCKADLTTGMVGEFPELQGVIGGYYARHDGEDRAVWDAVRDHYAPRGPGDDVPEAPVTTVVALADKLDQLVSFFRVGERPTGSGDAFALRRAALGVLRTLDGNRLNLHLRDLLQAADADGLIEELIEFLKERWRIQARARGERHDVVAAAYAGTEDRLDDLAQRVAALSRLLDTEDGANLLSGYRRAANILRIENGKDGPHSGDVDPALLQDDAEVVLAARLAGISESVGDAVRTRFYDTAMKDLSALRQPLDAFFDHVTVNSPQPELRANRLRVLNSTIALMHSVADFSKIEG